MPETTIDEHRDLASWEHDVGRPAQLRNRARVDAVSQTASVEFASQRDLGPSIRGSDGPHDRLHLRAAGDRSVHQVFIPKGLGGHPLRLGCAPRTAQRPLSLWRNGSCGRPQRVRSSPSGTLAPPTSPAF